MAFSRFYCIASIIICVANCVQKKPASINDELVSDDPSVDIDDVTTVFGSINDAIGQVDDIIESVNSTLFDMIGQFMDRTSTFESVLEALQTGAATAALIPGGSNIVTKVQTFIDKANTSLIKAEASLDEEAGEIASSLADVEHQMQSLADSTLGQFTDAIQAVTSLTNGTSLLFAKKVADVTSASEAPETDETQKSEKRHKAHKALKAHIADKVEKAGMAKNVEKADKAQRTRLVEKTHKSHKAHTAKKVHSTTHLHKSRVSTHKASKSHVSMHKAGKKHKGHGESKAKKHHHNEVALLQERAGARSQASIKSLESAVMKKGSTDPCSKATQKIVKANATLASLASKFLDVNSTITELLTGEFLTKADSVLSLVNSTLVPAISAAETTVPASLISPIEEALASLLAMEETFSTEVDDQQSDAGTSIAASITSLSALYSLADTLEASVHQACLQGACGAKMQKTCEAADAASL